MNLSIYLIDEKAGLVMFGFLIVYIVVAMLLYFFKRPVIIGDLIRYAADYGQVQKQLLKEMALPYAILDYEEDSYGAIMNSWISLRMKKQHVSR